MNWTIPDVPLESNPTDLYAVDTTELEAAAVKNELLTSSFWLDAGQRSIKTFAQSLIAVWGAGQFDILHTNPVQGLSLAAGAAVLSLLQSVGGAR